MLKQLLEKQKVFNQSLRILAVLSRRGALNGLTHLMTTILAQLNVFLNRPSPSKSLQDLGDRWLGMMPPDGQHLFKVEKAHIGHGTHPNTLALPFTWYWGCRSMLQTDEL